MNITVTARSTGKQTASTLAEFFAAHLGAFRTAHAANSAKVAIETALAKGEPHDVHTRDEVYTLANTDKAPRVKAVRTVFNSREKATALAALRFWYLHAPNAHRNENEIPAEVREFFSADFPLSPAEIDALCERINLEL